MKILVAYATKHGATQEIAERIAAKLVAVGQVAEARPAHTIHDVTGYDAIVIGSAAYIGSWLKEASEFARANQAILATRPVWLFSSGPLGTATTDDQGRDLRVVSEPKEFAEFRETIKPRDVHVFYGVLDPSRLAFSERMIRKLPAGRKLLPEGDFRNWEEIESWAEQMAHDLAEMPMAQS